MARLKRKSTVLETARRRLAGIKQISPPPNFGTGLTLEGFEAEIDGFTDDQDTYNGEIAALDEKTNLLDAREQRLADLNQRILAAVKGCSDRTATNSSWPAAFVAATGSARRAKHRPRPDALTNQVRAT